MFSFKNNNFIPVLPTVRRNDNTSTILFTNARDEPNIAEWVAHHLLLGFNKIIIFDHLSKIPISTSIGTNFNGRLTIIPIQGSGNIKIKLMNDALEIATRECCSWMLYLDADEYINLNRFNNIKDFLEYFKEADSIGINWLMFGSSNHISQPKGLLTENFTKSVPTLDMHVKTFVRPTSAVRSVNPHYFIVANPNRCYSGNGTRMPMGSFNKQLVPFAIAPIYIAHYYIQSEKEHLRRKNRMLDDGTVNKAAGFSEVHTFYNNVNNEQLKNKYSQKIKDFLKEHNIEL
jgi:hypothetical protein